MAEVILTVNTEIGLKIEADVITPDTFAGKNKSEIEALLVWQGPKQFPISAFFDVEGDAGASAEDTSIVIKGDSARVKRIGEKMTVGNITVEGSVSMHVGSQMVGGEILVKGDADSWAGMEMVGGLIHIEGNANDHVGCAYRGKWIGMSGGRIVIDGDANNNLGGGISGGEIIVGGNVGHYTGIRQNGGLIAVKGNAIRAVAAEMTAGTMVVNGTIERFSPGFEYVTNESDLKFDDIECPGEFMKFLGDNAITKRPKGTLYVNQAANLDL
ncbi:formylmethanofuran dehydrogenase subunit C [Methanococcoides burtonii]|uniref:formylmethanofuran dehydrogenase n=1 Tax=Methanococcoides burtonii (strain DSM 6242 / NBRC 107633 / OCM 468 / ACE-M) TaxID=259564 RepID=Q12Z39_METBU|nr:formylmethanofuran dehydrogenase subunit C [Methanococcoides burtonii]ABE51287.1 Molybdenum formylmethanofuran dehydrogenase subunit C [Methanococcoides burtonii DSM 6242]